MSTGNTWEVTTSPIYFVPLICSCIFVLCKDWLLTLDYLALGCIIIDSTSRFCAVVAGFFVIKACKLDLLLFQVQWVI